MNKELIDKYVAIHKSPFDIPNPKMLSETIAGEGDELVVIRGNNLTRSGDRVIVKNRIAGDESGHAYLVNYSDGTGGIVRGSELERFVVIRRSGNLPHNRYEYHQAMRLIFEVFDGLKDKDSQISKIMVEYEMDPVYSKGVKVIKEMQDIAEESKLDFHLDDLPF